MPSQNFPKILEQNSLVRCIGRVSNTNLGSFYCCDVDSNLIQNDIYVRLSKISENKCQLLIAKKTLLYENPPKIFFNKYTDEKTAKKEYNEIIETDKKRREKLADKIFNKN